jgi:2-methylisocitrate lyase-like PEP mutase family enzyme
MDMQEQANKAEVLRQLHKGPKILVLPNAWDVVSARIVEDAGFPAVATTSAGIANSLGYRDGQRVSREEMLDVVGRIARAVKVPVTADFEAGYGTIIEEMRLAAKGLVEAGAVGLNFEDVTGDDESTQVPIELQVAKIKTIRETSAAMGVPLVINARTDIYLIPIGPEESRFQRTVERSRAYREAGADCLFVPGLQDRELIAKLVKAVDAPLNILLQPNGPGIAELQKLGVARASAGSGLMRTAMGAARKMAKALGEGGDFTELMRDAIPYAEINGMLAQDKK